MDILSWDIAEVVSPCLPRGLWSKIVISVFLLLGIVCPRHPPGATLLFSRAFPYLQPGDMGGHCSAPAVCQSLTSADPMRVNANETKISIEHLVLFLSYSELHTHTTVLQPSWILSWTTQLSCHQKGKTSLDLLQQDIVSGNDISWAICKSAPWPRNMTTPAFHHSIFFTGQMSFLLPNEQHQSTEGS